MHVVEVESGATHDLRRRVLREGRPEADLVFPEDQVPGSFHLAAVDESGAVLGVASFAPQPTPFRPEASAARLRGMAVEPSEQQRGVGRALLGAAAERLREAGVEVLWANGRDATLSFYRRLGWEVVGEGFLADTGPGVQTPHHVVLVEL